ncbi:ABC transporter substrate-binding protein [Yinghuangia soli]|uniref:ABC transporter substrate-binding protein n=1 Tax=Yinghuangia soli TaxID=2908204 RepID=A0AA41PWK3_9ACTN|nr:ABC transporter substrate-binding protein [Yinghuangia soli]MCF2525882.1 ABC transporter substrate-binding protein [Yinghuangia soli]
MRLGTRGRPVRSRLAAGGAGLALVLLATACGGDGDSADASTPSTLPGTPIKVGLFNPDAGALALPGVKPATDAAVKYINGELGGIGGHPLEVVSCSIDGTPESTIACANKFVQDKVVAAFDGFNYSSSAGIGSLLAAKTPLVGNIAFDQTTGSSSDGRVYFAAPQASFIVGALQGFKAEGKTSATLTLQDLPTSHKTMDTQVAPLAGLLGIKATGLYFSPTNPNFSAVASTIASTKPDVAGLIASPSESICTQLVKNLRSVGYRGQVLVAACTSFIKSDPASAPGSVLYSSVWMPGSEKNAPPAAVEQLKLATKYLTEKGSSADFYSYAQFATVVNFAKGLATAQSLDNLTGATVLATLQSLRDFPSFLGPNISCGKPTSPNCTTQMLLFEVGGDLTLQPVTRDWITPAAEILAQIPGAS